MYIIRKMNKRGRCWKTCFIRTSLVYSALLHISHIGGLLQDQYVGCFKLTPPAADHNSKDYQLTIQKCIAKCVIQGATYAALLNGTICECVSDYGAQLSDESCNITCSGNQFESCGGATVKSSIYSVSVVYTVCPIGSYGPACDELCHCKRQTPCDRMTGHCPDGCDGQYTGPSCNTILLREQHIGCFKDKSSSHALTHVAYLWNLLRNTIEMCTNTCANASYSYAGLQFARQCFCGENYDNYGGLPETKCSSKCTGNKDTFCGGLNANSVYSVCPVGRYGNGCREKCNCRNNARCVYRTGLCPLSQCKPGWTGDSCNIRDCTSYNGDCRQNEKCFTVDLKFSKLSTCRCSDGFQRRKIWENCIDEDECSEDRSVCGQEALNCVNTIGGYQCFCPNGQTTYNMACKTDGGKCSKLSFVCGQDALNCVNTIGGYQCFCPNGQTTYNTACQTDSGQCSKLSFVCGPNALNCTNTIGGYQCLCPDGNTSFNAGCVIEKDEPFGIETMEPNYTWIIVGTAGGVLLCVIAILVVGLVVHICRRKQRNSPPTSSEKTYCAATIEGTTYYETLDVSTYNTETYEQIEEHNV